MTERAANWLIYTCLLGLIPVFCRLAVWLVVQNGVSPIATVDLIIFGLVIHSANINEVNRIADADPAWQTVHNGASIFFLIIYALFLFAAISEWENIQTTRLLIISLIMGLISIFLAITVIRRADVLAGSES